VTQILLPTSSFADWKKLLAKPDLHWKAGFSAMTLARAWEEAKDSGFPAEIAALLKTAARSDWDDPTLLLAIPEYRVPLPGGARASQTDLMALARTDKGLIAIAVEGKVDESLGPTVEQKREEESPGVDARIKYLCETLGISNDCPGTIRYQLLHRTVSAIQIAREFFAESAVMIIHSFSPDKKWLGDFQRFATLLGADAQPGRLCLVGKRGGVQLYLGWAVGDQKFRAAVSEPVQGIG
jgi:hypothetical protein